MTNSESDRLVLLARQGDSSAQHELLVLHRERLRRLVVSMLDPRLAARVDPSDVLQDAFAKAAQKLPDYLQDQPVAFYPWLRQIVKEKMIDVQRQHIHAKRRSVEMEHRYEVFVSDASAMHLADRLISREPSPSAVASNKEMIIQIKSAMEQLSAGDQELLGMRFNEQLRITEIAQVLFVSEVTARSRLRKALERLGRLVIH